ncbi:UDP-glycosyltransferase 87A2-like [Asparagus officinalis]|uniref:UDP-glycosyltransferase 87A2-like n=1 Tax=Asparagus officinalis TaxID=4686 RepID=UPI00098E0101|nr:UDP-glycosyltransferase 87A2-like [Asparagus officinalis]
MVRKANCILFTSFYELGAQVIDTLREQLHCPVYTIGPSIPYMHLEDTNNNIDHIEEWLDSQPKESVLYISLGSFLSVSGAQMDEIAVGLKLSGARFVWVVRGDFSSRLREMAGEMGIIVPWCNQLKVLNHRSIGGFLTHCGWNSTSEGVFCGGAYAYFSVL